MIKKKIIVSTENEQHAELLLNLLKDLSFVDEIITVDEEIEDIKDNEIELSEEEELLDEIEKAYPELEVSLSLKY